jgi:hypothetical protein
MENVKIRRHSRSILLGYVADIGGSWVRAHCLHCIWAASYSAGEPYVTTEATKKARNGLRAHARVEHTAILQGATR